MRTILEKPLDGDWTVESLEAAGYGELEGWELVEGRLIKKMGKRFEHVRTTKLFLKALMAVYEGPDNEVYSEAPIRLDSRSEPEPDVSVITLDATRELRTPKAVETSLVVEVAQTSHAKDFGQRRAMYARAGIPEMWIVDVPGRILHVYTQPDPETAEYDAHVIVTADEDVPGVGRPLRELLP